MITTYQLTSTKIIGDFTISFKAGVLIAIKMELEQCLNAAQYGLLFNKIPFLESDLSKLKILGLNVQPVVPTNKKIALFCDYYLQYKPVKYKVSPADSGKIKLVKIDDQLLKVYFTSDNFLFKNKHSISNLVKYYNELRIEVADHGKAKFPDHWSIDVENKLNPQQASEYWAHLRSVGLEAKKDARTGKTIDWVKKK